MPASGAVWRLIARGTQTSDTARKAVVQTSAVCLGYGKVSSASASRALAGSARPLAGTPDQGRRDGVCVVRPREAFSDDSADGPHAKHSPEVCNNSVHGRGAQPGIGGIRRDRQNVGLATALSALAGFARMRVRKRDPVRAAPICRVIRHGGWGSRLECRRWRTKTAYKTLIGVLMCAAGRCSGVWISIERMAG